MNRSRVIVVFSLFLTTAALGRTAPAVRWGQQLMSKTDDVPRSAVVDSEGGIYFVFNKQVKDAAGFSGSVISKSWFLLKYNQEGKQLWNKPLDPRIKDTDGIAADDHGNVYLFGTVDSTHEGEGKGGSDAFFAKIDKAGHQAWLFKLGTPEHDICTGIDLDADGNMYVSGYTNGDFAGPNKGGPDMFIAAYDQDRRLLWRDQIGSAQHDVAGDIRVGHNNDVYICGDTFGNMARVNNRHGDFVVARYDRKGKRLWLRQYGTDAYESGMCMEIGEFGDIYIGGRTNGSFGYRRPRRTDLDSCLVRITETGKMLWVRQFGTGAWDGAWDVARFTDGSGDVLIAGCQIPMKRKCQAFSRRYSQEGKLIWTKELRKSGEAGGSCGRVAAIDRASNVYLSGWTRADLFGINNGTTNMFIVRFDGEKGKKTSGTYAPKQSDIITNRIGMKLAYIPAGDFVMGSNDGASNEQPVHKVTISQGFYMGVTEVTQAQYKAVMGANPSHSKGDNNPVERVNRDDAMAFCRKLSQSDGRIYRLPSEAQWEYACRAGTTTEYSFGGNESELYKFGNYCDKSNTTGYTWQDKQHDDGYDKTAAVGSFRPNGFGLYDMHGNVWEWCRDWFDESYYSQSGAVDPENTRNTGFHLLRGGNWRNWASVCRSATRFRLKPGTRSNSAGFRVVIEVESAHSWAKTEGGLKVSP